MSTLIKMDDYTPQARTYWWVTTALGMVALAASLFGVSRLAPGLATVAVTGAVLAAIAGLMPATIPGTNTSVSTAEVFVFLLLLTVGPDAAVVAAGAEAMCISFRTSKRWTSRLASPAMAAIAMWVSAQLYVGIAGTLPATGSAVLATKIVLLFVVAAVYFSIGTLLIATLIKLKRSEPIRPLRIISHHAWLGLGYACAAAIAGLMQASFNGAMETPIALVAVLFTAALLAMLHLYCRLVVPRHS